MKTEIAKAPRKCRGNGCVIPKGEPCLVTYEEVNFLSPDGRRPHRKMSYCRTCGQKIIKEAVEACTEKVDKLAKLQMILTFWTRKEVKTVTSFRSRSQQHLVDGEHTLCGMKLGKYVYSVANLDKPCHTCLRIFQKEEEKKKKAADPVQIPRPPHTAAETGQRLNRRIAEVREK